jgi:hypothetical protein
MTSNQFHPSSDTFASKNLRIEFQPSDYSVVCGRGKGSFNHVGNRRFRILASMFTERYTQADSKVAKSAIVSDIIDVIRRAGGNFCKNKRGAWFEVGDHQAREKVSALMRDLVAAQCQSSAKTKTSPWSMKQKKAQDHQQSGQRLINDTGLLHDAEASDASDTSSVSSSCWGSTKESLGFEYWLEEPDNFFDIDVF